MRINILRHSTGELANLCLSRSSSLHPTFDIIFIVLNLRPEVKEQTGFSKQGKILDLDSSIDSLALKDNDQIEFGFVVGNPSRFVKKMIVEVVPRYGPPTMLTVNRDKSWRAVYDAFCESGLVDSCVKQHSAFICRAVVVDLQAAISSIDAEEIITVDFGYGPGPWKHCVMLKILPIGRDPMGPMMRMIVPVVDNFKVVFDMYCERMQLTPEIAATTEFFGRDGQNDGRSFDNGYDIDHMNLKDGAVILPRIVFPQLQVDLHRDFLHEQDACFQQHHHIFFFEF